MVSLDLHHIILGYHWVLSLYVYKSHWVSSNNILGSHWVLGWHWVLTTIGSQWNLIFVTWSWSVLNWIFFNILYHPAKSAHQRIFVDTIHQRKPPTPVYVYIMDMFGEYGGFRLWVMSAINKYILQWCDLLWVRSYPFIDEGNFPRWVN